MPVQSLKKHDFAERVWPCPCYEKSYVTSYGGYLRQFSNLRSGGIHNLPLGRYFWQVCNHFLLFLCNSRFLRLSGDGQSVFYPSFNQNFYILERHHSNQCQKGTPHYYVILIDKSHFSEINEVQWDSEQFTD